jgi:hypothetical protein
MNAKELSEISPRSRAAMLSQAGPPPCCTSERAHVLFGGGLESAWATLRRFKSRRHRQSDQAKRRPRRKLCAGVLSVVSNVVSIGPDWCVSGGPQEGVEAAGQGHCGSA